MFSILLTLTLASITTSYHIDNLNIVRFKSKEYFDLSYTFSNDTIYFPGQKQFKLDKNEERINGDGYSYSAYTISMAEHGGTHLDAPFHFNPAGWPVDRIPPNHLIDVPAILIDVSDEVNGMERPSEFVLDVKHIIRFETESKIIPFGAVVLLYTGWSKFWPNKVEYLGYDNSTGILNFPESVNAVPRLSVYLTFTGISENAAKWLVNERQIIGVGLDTASIDPGNTKTFPAHVIMAENQIYNLENVANLHLLLNASKDDCSLHLFVLPLKIVGGTGSPTRILAYCNDE